MIPVFQTLTTVNDGKGNCFIACVASLMELPLRELPSLANDLNGGQYFIALERWMEPRGLFPTHHATMPKGWSIAGVYTGKERLPHAVVAYNGKTIHDPHPLGGKLSDADSWWTLDSISNEQRQTVRSSAPQEPDDDALLGLLGEAQLMFALGVGAMTDNGDKANQERCIREAGELNLRISVALTRLQAKAPETD